MGILNKFGEHAGAVVSTVLIPSTQVPFNNVADIDDFGCTVFDTAGDTTYTLQKSTDDFVGNVVPISRIYLPVGGTFKRGFDAAIKIEPLQWFRVVFIQVIPGAVSAELQGRTTGGDIKD